MRFFKSPWTWAVAAVVAQFLNLIFIPGLMAKSIATGAIVMASLAIMGLKKGSNTSFLLAVCITLFIAAMFAAWMNLTSIFPKLLGG